MTDTSPADRLERSMLYVPASRPDMIEKAAASEADGVCIDLEDAVAVDEKAASRANVVRAFRELDFGRSPTATSSRSSKQPATASTSS
jgi:citrate lyase beta subunit